MITMLNSSFAGVSQFGGVLTYLKCVALGTVNYVNIDFVQEYLFWANKCARVFPNSSYNDTTALYHNRLGDM